MFFLILSKTVISNKSSNKYFSLFVSGMIFYIILHYYMNIIKPEGFLDYLNDYFYYLLVLDFIISISLLNHDEVEEFNNDDDDDNEDNFVKEKYSDDEKLKILQNLQNLQKQNADVDVKENNNEELFLKKEQNNAKERKLKKIIEEGDQNEISKLDKEEKINNEEKEEEKEEVVIIENNVEDDVNLENDDIDIDIENENTNINIKNKNSESLTDTELPIFEEK